MVADAKGGIDHLSFCTSLSLATRQRRTVSDAEIGLLGDAKENLGLVCVCVCVSRTHKHVVADTVMYH